MNRISRSDYQEVFELAKKVLNEENQKNNFNLSVNVFSFKSYFSSDFFKQKFKLCKNKIHSLLSPFKYSGVYNPDNDYILIFPSTCLFSNSSSKTSPKTRVLKTCFHEITHAKQVANRSRKYGYRYFERIPIQHMEDAIQKYDHNFYLHNHDSFYKEIDANLKSSTMTKKYLRDNYPDTFMKDKEELQNQQIYYDFQKKNYNFDFFLEKILSIYRTNPKEFYGSPPDFYPISSILFKPNSTEFTSIKDIMKVYEQCISQHEMFRGVKPTAKDENEYFEFFATALTSDVFLNQLDLKSLNNDEKKFLDLACLYSLNTERDRENYNHSVSNLPFIDRTILYANTVKNKNKINLLKELIQNLNVNSLDNSQRRK